MKLFIAAISLALVTATSAAAMIGPYERAVNENPAASGLTTTGMVDYTRISQANSPEAEWTNGGQKKATVFSTKGNAYGSSQFGADAR